MAAPAEPPAYSVSYGGFCVNSSSFANTMLPCKMEASISLPPSPSSSRSSLSLEPLSAPGSGCLPEALLSTPYIDIPSLLDRPSSCTPFSHLSRQPCPFTLRKRPASFSSELETSAPIEGVHMGSKRICESTLVDGSIPYRSREAGSGSASRPDDAHGNEFLDGSMWRSGCTPENVASKDLDDMLDLLLQEAEVPPALSAQSKSPGCHESSLLTYKFDHCKEESKELYTKLSSNHLVRTAPSLRTWSDMLQEGSSRTQKPIEGSAASNGMGTHTELVKANARRCSEELMNQIASTSGSPRQEGGDFKKEKLQEDQSKTKQQAIKSWQGSSGRWAGPTLLDIESALASTSTPPPPYPFGKPPAFTPSSFLYSIRDILQQEPPPPHFLSSFVYKEEPSLEEDDKLATWRRLQKRNHVEPRYTVKIRCEEDAVNDGYRWRKYGQKSIKNSPYPRSYYRCSSGKCNVKKQVERSGEDTGLLLVSYEGIHLHHRPTSLLSPTLPYVSTSPSHV